MTVRHVVAQEGGERALQRTSGLAYHYASLREVPPVFRSSSLCRDGERGGGQPTQTSHRLLLKGREKPIATAPETWSLTRLIPIRCSMKSSLNHDRSPHVMVRVDLPGLCLDVSKRELKLFTQSLEAPHVSCENSTPCIGSMQAASFSLCRLSWSFPASPSPFSSSQRSPGMEGVPSAASSPAS